MPFLNLFVLLESLLLLAIGLVYTLRLQKQEKELKYREKQAHATAEKLLEHAQTEAQSILKHALHKAEEMVDKTDIFTENLEAHLEHNLKEKSTDVTNLFGKTVIEMKDEYMKEIAQSFKTLEEQGKKQMTEFQILLKNEGLTHQTFIDQKLDEDFEATKKEIEEYKRNKIEEIKGLMSSRVNELSMKVLGKSLSSKDQEKLIIEALDEAKKEGLLL